MLFKCSDHAKKVSVRKKIYFLLGTSMNLSGASVDGVIQGAFNEYLAKTTNGVCLHGNRVQNRKKNRQSEVKVEFSHNYQRG